MKSARRATEHKLETSYEFEEVEPSDTRVYDPLPIGVRVGVPGDLVVKTIGGKTVTLKNASGQLNIRPYQILEDTTAGNIVLLW